MIELIKNIKFIDVLALVVVLFCFSFFYIKALDNGLIALVAAVVSYYFGASVGKDKKPDA